MATVNFALPDISTQQVGVDVRYNFMQGLFDALYGRTVKSATTTAQPGSPVNGDVYWIPGSPTGTDWTGHANTLTVRLNGTWYFFTLGAGQEGWMFYAQDSNLTYVWDGSALAAIVLSGISAAGTTQGAATLLSVRNSIVTTATGGSADGVRLPPAFLGNEFTIYNASIATINVYPATSGTIDALSANVPITIAANKAARLLARDTTNWCSWKGA